VFVKISRQKTEGQFCMIICSIRKFKGACMMEYSTLHKNNKLKFDYMCLFLVLFVDENVLLNLINFQVTLLQSIFSLTLFKSTIP
jgi:hypothetical protein